ncbi:alpha/beta fold hydrolase [Saccharomonospora sp. NB11]|jgi:pimeloyl-ACP methyl ester carboxylesterase|uniref:alpha/beta fold hydrolase n=1 Tax=Saccharomonospora sp. NB11 TaxID=1642298 RepID=UPI0018D02B83|nr:alpha/beta hydrolase [Saccharomonospora sp. NB11]
MTHAPLPVLFLHGIRVSGTMWHPQLHEVGQRRPVSAPDLPGHGHRRGQHFTLAGAVDLVRQEIDDLGGRALVVGLSLGGYVGIAAASRLGDRVAGLVAMGCTAVPTPERTRPLRVAGGLLRRLPDGGDRLNHRLFAALWGERAATVIGERGFATEAMPDALDELVRFDPLAEVARYGGPVWLVNGGRDHFRVDEQRFLDVCERARLVVVPRVGHLVPIAAPRVVSRLVSEVAEQVDDGTVSGVA